MLLSTEQMSCFHVMGHTTFVSLQFSRKQVCGHKRRYVLCIFATYSKNLWTYYLYGADHQDVHFTNMPSALLIEQLVKNAATMTSQYLCLCKLSC